MALVFGQLGLLVLKPEAAVLSEEGEEFASEGLDGEATRTLSLSFVKSSPLQVIKAEEKNSCLCTAIYDILSTRFGTRAPSRSQNLSQYRIRKQDRALKEVTHLKYEAS